MKRFLRHTPIVLKQMVRLPAFILVGSVVCAGLILIELGSISNNRPPAKIEPAAPEIRKPADQLLGSTQRPPGTSSAAGDADLPLRDVRLTGVVIGPGLRIAIFAVTGASSRALSEGEALKGWRLESISPERVVLSGPTGKTALEPEPDANLVRPSSPVAVQSDQPRAAIAGASGRPVVVTPIAVGNLSAGSPVPMQSYPYSPEYYPESDPYYPWASGWAYPWGWGWPVGVSTGLGGCRSCGLRGGSFRPGFRRLGFGHRGFFHSGFGGVGFSHAKFGGGFRGSGRR